MMSTARLFLAESMSQSAAISLQPSGTLFLFQFSPLRLLCSVLPSSSGVQVTHTKKSIWGFNKKIVHEEAPRSAGVNMFQYLIGSHFPSQPPRGAQEDTLEWVAAPPAHRVMLSGQLFSSNSAFANILLLNKKCVFKEAHCEETTARTSYIETHLDNTQHIDEVNGGLRPIHHILARWATDSPFKSHVQLVCC